ncbi:hypothetical protein BpHYR1_053731 [Brachionus plicatilis]|uniref:Uncharacterized protein n=1 Tax=Brachionus plicatilis TaxID=10195 RepID=A0A3M7PT29_BRAPC|nr:hypothetical protein BpHYR1_053731 [Brachionus plicatilis]
MEGVLKHQSLEKKRIFLKLLERRENAQHNAVYCFKIFEAYLNQKPNEHILIVMYDFSSDQVKFSLIENLIRPNG